MADAGEEPPPAAAAQTERWLTIAGKLNVRMSSIIMTILIRLLNALRETS